MDELHDKQRADFLLKMYEAYNKEIERHFGLAWQAVSIFAASLIAIATSVEKLTNVPPYIVISLYLLLITWAIEVILDAAFWYNRNLVVIANIERQFLKPSDSHDIHWYFLSHRPVNAPLTFMRILLLFLLACVLVVLAFYFFDPAVSGRGSFYRTPTTYIPLVIAFIAALVVRTFAQKKNADYDDFKKKAPGGNVEELESRSAEHDLADRRIGIVSHVVIFLETLLLAPLGVKLKEEVGLAEVISRWIIILACSIALVVWIGFQLRSDPVTKPTPQHSKQARSKVKKADRSPASRTAVVRHPTMSPAPRK